MSDQDPTHRPGRTMPEWDAPPPGSMAAAHEALRRALGELGRNLADASGLSRLAAAFEAFRRRLDPEPPRPEIRNAGERPIDPAPLPTLRALVREAFVRCAVPDCRRLRAAGCAGVCRRCRRRELDAVARFDAGRRP